MSVGARAGIPTQARAAAPVEPRAGGPERSGPADDREPVGSGNQPAGGAPGSLREARSELARQFRERRRVRLVALAMGVLLVLGAVPLFFGVRAAAGDPVFRSLDGLAVPEWAAVETTDGVSGSRWCFIECRFRERIANSERSTAETAQAYEQALAEDGWRPWQVAFCPEQAVEGKYTCWQRDEMTLDLWVRDPACAADPLRNRPTVAPSGGQGEGSAAPVPEEECSGSVVSVKVRNAIDDERTRPQPSTDPSLTGVDPDPVFTDDPLREPTPSPS